MDLNELAREIHETAREKGFWRHEILHEDPAAMECVRNPSIHAEKIALMHSELSEALEALRDARPKDEVAVELADCIIRILDYAHWMGLPIQEAVLAKVEKNKGRPYMHGRKW